MKRTKVWRVEGIGPPRADQQVFAEVVYIEAYSGAHARLRAGHMGMAPQSATPIPRADVPSDHAVVDLDITADRLDALERIAMSPLVRSPFLTIALAVFVGVLASSCLLSAILNARR